MWPPRTGRGADRVEACAAGAVHACTRDHMTDFKRKFSPVNRTDTFVDGPRGSPEPDPLERRPCQEAVSGQIIGIVRQAATPVTRLSGRPIRVKSVNLYPPGP